MGTELPARLLLALLAMACAQRREAPVPDLEAAELRRAPSPEVRALLSSPSTAVRGRAALAAGRIGDPEAVPRLSELLDDVEVGEIAAWALGRIEGGEAALATCLERGCRAAQPAARALAGAAAAKHPRTDVLIKALSGPAGEEAAFAVGILARNPATAFPDGTHAALSSLLPRTGAAYALSRLAKGAVDRTALERALKDRNPWTRALAARAWGKQGLPAAGLQTAFDDADWRVRAEAARGLSTAEYPADVLRDQLSQQHNAQVLVALYEAAGQLGEPVDAPARASLWVRCAAAVARDKARKAIAETPSCEGEDQIDWRARARTGALAAELGLVEAARRAFRDRDGRVRAAAASAAAPSLSGDVRALLFDPDPFVVQNAASALARDPQGIRDVARAAALRLLAAHQKPAGNPESDALAALAGLTGAMPELLPTPNAALASALGARIEGALPVPADARDFPHPRRLYIRTRRGEMIVALRPDLAPLTTSALAALAKRNFYDGLTFHRVVPDFVVQGGDPRGDGDGGPGWALPDEHTPARFVRGTLGIATSGPETGGSQFFLCHSPQPHLDGRYTVAGQLAKGDPVLDGLQQGDDILSAAAE